MVRVMLSRDQILARRELPRETVDVPEWGGSVIVSVMSGTDRDNWERKMWEARHAGASTNMRAHLVARCVVDDQGARVFTDSDAEELGRLNWLALERIVTVAQRLNKLTEQDVEDLKGNS